MEDAAEQPTINDILKDFSIDAFLDMYEYAELLTALEHRDNVMRTDAAKHLAKKSLMKALDKIIEEV